VYQSIPRCALHAKGKNIGNEVWGNIIVEEYIDVNDELVACGEVSQSRFYPARDQGLGLAN